MFARLPGGRSISGSPVLGLINLNPKPGRIQAFSGMHLGLYLLFSGRHLGLYRLFMEYTWVYMGLQLDTTGFEQALNGIHLGMEYTWVHTSFQWNTPGFIQALSGIHLGLSKRLVEYT